MDSSTDTSLAVGACPPLEDLAAFLDGTISKEERERIVAHLADCETCYNVFAGAADFQLTSAQADEPKGKVARFPFGSKKTLPWWLTAAAAAVLVVLVGLPTYRFLVPPEMTVAELTEPVAGKTGLSQYLYPAATYRGKDDAGDLLSDSHSFLAGVFLVDLRLTLEAGDKVNASDLLRRIGVQASSFFQSGDLSDKYLQRASTLAEAQPAEAEALLRQFDSELPSWEKELEERTVSEYSFDFGKWTEAGRIAAKAQTPEFFARRENRRFLTWLHRRQKDEIDPEILPDLQEIRRTWKSRGLQPVDFLKLEKQLSRIIEHYERESEQIFQDYEP